MEKRGKDMNDTEKTYRIQGFTCANCAGVFEKNVKELPQVSDAKVNFGASKLKVYGEVSIEELEKAGAFENLKVYPEKERQLEQKPFWKQQHFIQTVISGLLLIIGWALVLQRGESDGLAIGVFAAAMVIGGHQLFWQGLKNLTKFRFDMKTLMTIAIIGASLIGEWGEGATVVFLFAISEALERFSMDKARQSIRSLMDLAPRTATVIKQGEMVELAVDEIEIGDVMIVKPGQKIPMDGTVQHGVSTVNQAAITGESIPVAKSANDEVYAGTLNEEGLLEIKVTKRVEDTTLSKIIELVEEAQAERAPSQAFVDRFAKYYTPLIMLVALGVATVPPLFFSADWSLWVYQGLAVLVVGCPCALVISTPVSIVTAIGNSARNGVLIKGGVYLEQLGSIQTIAFDKTGTLTNGVPEVTDVVAVDPYTEQEVLKVGAYLEKSSAHPLASAVMQRASQEGIEASKQKVDHFRSITGKGITGLINNESYYVGSPIFFKELTIDVPAEVHSLQKQGKTVILVGKQNELLGYIAVSDRIRSSSSAAVRRLKQLGVKNTTMLTGDNEETAKAIGNELGIDQVKAQLLPDEKLKYVKQMKESGQVVMVGDGVNDAPALATADIGIAMGGAGTDAALETADIALMGDDLRKLPFAIRLSRKTLTIIKQNIAFALGLKALALLLVIPGWLTLWIAIFADMGATLLVTLNGLRLLRVKDKE
ncbi:heavy metal translocating P-type ATPase [Alkalihalobacterium chitinilyticum]|uniref:Cd(2+)-exporting ATPase n=1 Tax=Alkalihalobacterium chitinilyticum TaxID=2980103 RepID=A0ABT5VLA6_9BACI|nr:heavy metal translocating P-type ATPase [Alkalihalobacterium chitinilyticum]MDE5416228.1 heavy metal translocating P-type ATPase [Alkalihalobacterium chitinilyticum]